MFHRHARESIGMLVSCIGAAVILSMFGPRLLLGSLGILLLGGAALAGVLTIVIEVRRGVGLSRSALGVLFVVVLTLAVTYAPLWWMNQQMSSGQPLFQLTP